MTPEEAERLLAGGAADGPLDIAGIALAFAVLDNPGKAVEPYREHLADMVRAAGVETDARGTMLRLGPAPYLSDDQLREAVAILGEVAARPSASLAGSIPFFMKSQTNTITGRPTVMNRIAETHREPSSIAAPAASV